MIEVPATRRRAAREIAERLGAARSIVVLTHVRGDGDGWGSAAALAHHYAPLGVDVQLLAATPFPERFRFLLPPGAVPLDPGEAAEQAMASADAQVLVDVAEPSRLGEFAGGLDPSRTIVIDHHPMPSDDLRWSVALIDPEAAATVELIFDVLRAGGEPLGLGAARAIYVGLVTDTGSFRYSNVNERTHRLAADLVGLGVDPASIYRRLYGRMTRRELEVLKAALESLRRDPELPISWIALDAAVEQGTEPLDDYERVLEYARTLEDTEVALLFRELEDGSVKVSLRSNGAADVSAIAREFGGGGHEKAAGVVVKGDLDRVESEVIDRCRAAVRNLRSGAGRA